ncbi:MAG: TonB family protein [Janthinobacterium lividum]
MHLLTANLDDIVFEGRNQAYGAYQLRQQYRSNLASAGGITLGVCMLLLGTWLAWPATQSKPMAEHPVLVETMLIPPTVVEPPKQAVLAPPRALAPPRTHPAPVQPTQVAKDQLVPPPPKPVAATEPVEIDGPVGPPTTGPTDPLASAAMASIGGTPGGTNTAVEAAGKELVFVEKMPEFAGGQAALLRYLRDHMRYPSQALREQAEGRVFMSFVVRADGTIADVTVLKGLGFGLDEEALRVVRQMPAWTPGYQAQHAVAVRFTLPITFKIQ